jgi:hypothetical protein
MLGHFRPRRTRKRYGWIEVLRMARVIIGTSGWHYGSWRGPFFPVGLPLKAQLQY